MRNVKNKIAEEIAAIAFDRNEKTADRLRALGSLNNLQNEKAKEDALKRLDKAIAEFLQN
ncbi:MAG: hypothetical protein IJU75_06880 [Clostridia bacterium]|nr:hypothetical protein [Clostridia bacterium]